MGPITVQTSTLFNTVHKQMSTNLNEAYAAQKTDSYSVVFACVVDVFCVFRSPHRAL